MPPTPAPKLSIVWKIEQMTTEMVKGDLEKVVLGVSWRATATKGSLRADLYNTASFTEPEPDSFLEYADLTEDGVLQWVYATGVDKAAIEAALTESIAIQEQPPKITALPLPW